MKKIPEPKNRLRKTETVSSVPAARTTVKKVMVGKGKTRVDLLPMVLQIIKTSYKGQRIEYQDLVGEGLLAVSQARHRFDPTKKAKLSTFAYRRIRGAVRDLVEKEDRYVARYELVDTDSFDALEGRDGFEGHLSDRLLFLQVVEVIEKRLPQREALVLVRTFLEEASDTSIAQELDISEGQVNSLRLRALQTVRSFFYGQIVSWV